MDDRDKIAWPLGIVIMGIGMWEPWTLPNADAGFAFGFGLTISPMAKFISELWSPR